MALEVNSVPSGGGPDSVGTAEIVDGSIVAVDIANGAVTPAKVDATGSFTFGSVATTGNVSAGTNRVLLDGSTGAISVGDGTTLIEAWKKSGSFVRSESDVAIGGSYLRVDNTLNMQGGSITFGVLEDADLYRGAAGVLRTSGSLTVDNDLTVLDDILLSGTGSRILFQGLSGDVSAIDVLQTGDSFGRVRVTSGGVIEWGDGAGAQDANLYRSAANELRTDDAFSAGGAITGLSHSALAASSGAITFASTFSPNTFPSWRLTAAGRLEWGDGTSIDTNLYRDAANVLKTDDLLSAAGLVNSGRNVVNVTTVAASGGTYAVTATDEVIHVTGLGGAAHTVELPAAPEEGRRIEVKDYDGGAGTNTLTVTTADAATIDGAATATVSGNYDSLEVVAGSNGNWAIH